VGQTCSVNGVRRNALNREWRLSGSRRWQGVFKMDRTKMVSGLWQTVCFVVLKLRVLLPECYTGLLSFPDKLPMQKILPDTTVRDTEFRRLLYQVGCLYNTHFRGGQILQCPTLTGIRLLRKCYKPLQSLAGTQNSYIICQEPKHCLSLDIFKLYHLLPTSRRKIPHSSKI
jgi:hypothetical protein